MTAARLAAFTPGRSRTRLGTTGRIPAERRDHPGRRAPVHDLSTSHRSEARPATADPSRCPRYVPVGDASPMVTAR
jgi:hypothetical protein